MTSFATIQQMLRLQAANSAESVALLAPDRAPLTYGQMLDHVTTAGVWLNALGIGRNDRVATVLPNGPEMALAFRLAPFKVPRCIIMVDRIPKGPPGKIQRIGLAQRLGVAAEPDAKE